MRRAVADAETEVNSAAEREDQLEAEDDRGREHVAGTGGEHAECGGSTVDWRTEDQRPLVVRRAHSQPRSSGGGSSQDAVPASTSR